MTVRERTKEVMVAAKAVIGGDTSKEMTEELLYGIEEMGHRLEEAEVHGHAMCVGFAMANGETLPEELNFQNLTELEKAGSAALFQVLPLQRYVGLVMEIWECMREMWEEDEDDEEETEDADD